MAVTGIPPAGASSGASAGQRLTPADRRQIEKLQSIDRNVRDHEAAHLRAGAGLVTSGPSYSYTYGPDGKRYAVGGEVGIDVAPTGKPQDDIDKARRIEAAALAPADPSDQDLAVASSARQMALRAQAELTAQRQQTQVAQAYGTTARPAGNKIDLSA
jgi:hypothetical protein